MDMTWPAFLESTPDESLRGPENVGVAWLKYVETVRNIMGDFAQYRGVSESRTRLMFAEVFVAQILGEDWTDKHIDSFKGQAGLEAALFKYRLWTLGKLLFDLQSFEWFGLFVNKVRSSDLPGASFEAEVVRLLMQLPVRAVLRKESGVKTADYDIDLGSGGLVVSVEVKAKNDATPFSAQTVRSTFRAARQQLPPEGIGLVFLRVPTAWLADDAYQREMDGVLAGLLRNSSRVHGVIQVWDEHSVTGATTMHFQPRQTEIRR